MIIELSKSKVEAKDQLSWYDAKEIESVMIGGAKMGMEGNVPKLTGIEGDILFKAKLKLFELSIISITEGDKQISYSLDWLKSLSQADGEKLDKELDGAYKDEKKN